MSKVAKPTQDEPDSDDEPLWDNLVAGDNSDSEEEYKSDDSAGENSDNDNGPKDDSEGELDNEIDTWDGEKDIDDPNSDDDSTQDDMNQGVDEDIQTDESSLGLGEDDTHAKRATSKRKTKRRVFPFIQKRKRAGTAASARPVPLYHTLDDIRDTAKEFLQGILKDATPKDVTTLEKIGFNAAVRLSKRTYPDRTLTLDDPEFRALYVQIWRDVSHSLASPDLPKIISDLKSDQIGHQSHSFDGPRARYDAEIKAIKDPVEEAQEDSNYPCPKCKGIRVTKIRRVDRSGDEGISLRLYCANRTCGYEWRLTG